jgi:predicted NBD/HSP70 family sugar kinase
MKLAKELAKIAGSSGACEERHAELLGLEDKRDMIKMYLDEIDFCMENDYPGNEFIKKHFKGVTEQYNIYLDDYIMLVNPDKVVALGETKGNIQFDSFTVGRVFLNHNSNVKIKVKDDAFVMIDIYGNSTVQVEASDNSKVCINRYGNSVIVFSEKDKSRVKIIEKKKRN